MSEQHLTPTTRRTPPTHPTVKSIMYDETASAFRTLVQTAKDKESSAARSEAMREVARVVALARLAGLGETVELMKGAGSAVFGRQEWEAAMVGAEKEAGATAGASVSVAMQAVLQTAQEGGGSRAGQEDSGGMGRVARVVAYARLAGLSETVEVMEEAGRAVFGRRELEEAMRGADREAGAEAENQLRTFAS